MSAEQRMAVMLDAAADVFAESGFDAATMTAIAERSGSPLYAEANAAERARLVEEFKLALVGYLNSRLGEAGD